MDDIEEQVHIVRLVEYIGPKVLVEEILSKSIKSSKKIKYTQNNYPVKGIVTIKTRTLGFLPTGES